MFGFLGPNGAGKTTTLRLLTGLTRPTPGSATVAGHEILTESVKVREHIGVVPEVSNIYDEMTAWDNLIFASQLHDVPKDQRETRAKARALSAVTSTYLIDIAVLVAFTLALMALAAKILEKGSS
ncbi:MAG: ATP-binding cassette domain-containing protein [Candidatus Bathyarchaeia archaeon]